MIINYNQFKDENYRIYIGELLRKLFFDSSKGKGCYSTFEINDSVMPERDRLIPYWDIETNFPKICFEERNTNEDEYYTTYSLKTECGIIYMMYHWDGDGVLIFEFPNKSLLVNSDCKKNYCWKFYNTWQEYMVGEI
jgi:hypothetical protein